MQKKIFILLAVLALSKAAFSYSTTSIIMHCPANTDFMEINKEKNSDNGRESLKGWAWNKEKYTKLNLTQAAKNTWEFVYSIIRTSGEYMNNVAITPASPLTVEMNAADHQIICSFNGSKEGAEHLIKVWPKNALTIDDSDVTKLGLFKPTGVIRSYSCETTAGSPEACFWTVLDYHY